MYVCTICTRKFTIFRIFENGFVLFLFVIVLNSLKLFKTTQSKLKLTLKQNYYNFQGYFYGLNLVGLETAIGKKTT